MSVSPVLTLGDSAIVECVFSVLGNAKMIIWLVRGGELPDWKLSIPIKKCSGSKKCYTLSGWRVSRRNCKKPFLSSVSLRRKDTKLSLATGHQRTLFTYKGLRVVIYSLNKEKSIFKVEFKNA